MVPILLCSVVATAIICERFWSLRRKNICPDHLVSDVWLWAKSGLLDANKISELRISSSLGRVLASGLVNLHQERAIMRESIEETGRHAAHELERFLNTLGTIAVITPLLGLLGTVFGMIDVFTVVTVKGIGNPAVLSDGIAKALITTAAGLMVAIPSLMFHRFFQRRIDDLTVTMEQEALKMVEVLNGERVYDDDGEAR
ncbi:MAG: biopolymer transport protein ExbB [Halothiobacillaceae bacterium]|nr:MAG: biopolymer transport protein ExbB [Halothiobacillaceae bacterium]